jgi:hypothetical protein
MILESDIANNGNANGALMARRYWSADGCLNIEIAPPFAAGECWRNHPGMIGERQGACRRLKSEKSGKGIIAIFFVCARDPLFEG